jgi:hypothetical protein
MRCLSTGVLFITLLSGINSANACIWREFEPSYWPREIPICFTNAGDSERTQEVAQLVQDALEAEINTRTPFNLQGFGECGPVNPNRRELRLFLDERQVMGQAFPDGTPESQNFNVRIPAATDHVSFSRPDNSRPLTREYIMGQTVHEILHMFGIQHDVHRDDAYMVHSAYGGQGDRWAFGDYDPNSVMVRGSADRPNENFSIGQIMSEGDVQCMNIISSADFPGHPLTQLTTEAYTGNASEDPKFQPTEDNSPIDEI